MYDIKSIESGEKKHENILNNYYQKNSSYTSISSFTSPFSTLSTVSSATSSLSSISSTILSSSSSSSTISPTFSVNNPCSAISAVTTATTNNSMLLRRRRIFQRQACLLSVMAAFSLGLALGVFIPMIGMSAAFTSTDFLTTDRNNKTATIINNNQQNTLANTDSQQQNGSIEPKHPPSNFPTIYETDSNQNNKNNNNNRHHIPHQMVTDTYSVSFVKDKELPAENSYQQNSIHLRQDKNSDSIKLDSNIKHNVKEFRLQQRSSNDHLYGKGSEKDSLMSKLPLASTKERIEVEFIPIESKISSKMQSYLEGIIKDGIYWGDLIERSLPRGYSNQDAEHWNTYVRNAVITHLEVGCGRMQNRMVIFSDGTKACARYRQNTDQIQGELFSFYLGQLLNLTNLAPSAASVIDLETETWSNAIQDITLAQWKSFRPVVLTKWLPNLEPAGIPTPFQPLERHLNKFDVWNITLGIDHENKIHQQQHQQQQQQQQHPYQKGLLERLGAAIIDDQSQRSADPFNIGGVDDVIAPDVASSSNGQDIKISGINNDNDNVASDSVAIAISNDYNHDHDDDHSLTSHQHHHYHHQQQQHHYQQNNHLKKQTISNNDDGLNVGNKYDKDRLINSTILNRLIELAQWSDLIIFDYLIANLDRVVNNLYNYQWNADIMAAPAHNLAKQTNSKLLVFLDNESGLLHGYRLLKKYEAYHGLLLDNLCVFRKTTIQSLQSLRDYGVGHQLQQLFEKLTSHQIRDVLPSLPDKSIKILIDRIDRVLGQVHKCRDLFSDR